MGSKKKTPPMWEEVADVTRLAVGDIVVWPAEKGKIMHLHGSASTMRKLGFSIGNRYRSSTYAEMEYLASSPKTTKLMLVVDTTSMYRGAAEDPMEFDQPAIPRRTSVRVVRLPLNLAARVASPESASISQYDAIFEDLAKSGRFGKYADFLGSAGKEDHYANEIVREMNYRIREEFLADASEGVTDAFLGAWNDNDPADPVEPDRIASYVSAAQADAGSVTPGTEAPVITFPVPVVVKARRYGVKVLRPTAETKASIAAVLAAHAASRAVSKFARMADAMDGFARLASKLASRYRVETRRATALSGRLGRSAAPVALALSALAGEDANMRFYIRKGVS